MAARAHPELAVDLAHEFSTSDRLELAGTALGAYSAGRVVALPLLVGLGSHEFNVALRPLMRG